MANSSKREAIDRLAQTILNFNPDQSRTAAQAILDLGIDPLEAIANGLAKRLPSVSGCTQMLFRRWSSGFIEGDNLVLKLLHKTYFGRVKMMYIDPPYNIGKERIYTDNYGDPLDTCGGRSMKSSHEQYLDE